MRLAGPSAKDLDAGFDNIFADRQREADEFYARLNASTGASGRITRQACAGLLWSKQFYYYAVDQWLEGDPAQPAPPAKTTNAPVAGATPSTGTDVDNVRVDGGKIFPYPEYLRNLMNEILRRWARPAGAAALEAEVSFTIFRDGSVRDIKVVRGSRSYDFNLEAQGAVEQAAAARAFGPLPKGWPSDILQVAFLFTPRKSP